MNHERKHLSFSVMGLLKYAAALPLRCDFQKLCICPCKVSLLKWPSNSHIHAHNKCEQWGLRTLLAFAFFFDFWSWRTADMTSDIEARFWAGTRVGSTGSCSAYCGTTTDGSNVPRVPDLTPNSSSGKLQRSKMLNNKNMYRQTDRTNISKHSTTRNVVQS